MRNLAKICKPALILKIKRWILSANAHAGIQLSLAKGYQDVCEREKVQQIWKAIQLLKDPYSKRMPVGDGHQFYLDTNSTWKYHELVEHLIPHYPDLVKLLAHWLEISIAAYM